MHLGIISKSAKEGNEYTSSFRNGDITNLIIDISMKRKRWFKLNHLEEYTTNFSTNVYLPKYEYCLSDFMAHSVDLCNSSHYDVGDDSMSTCTWIEEDIGKTDNWYFVFPNVTMDYKKAIVIKLFNGCTITWDARKLRHASSRTIRIRGGGGTTAGNCELRKKKKKNA